jgi:lipoate-protein ligase A
VIAARFIDLGLVDAAPFHATYAGIAAAAPRDAAPVVLWGRTRPHIALGASQDAAAELVEAPGVPVIQRPLGGGAVWVDEDQHCFVLITPRDQVPPQPARWFARGLAPAIETYRHFGLNVERQEHDLWLGGRKIAGSGAGTIGRCAVLASSFLLRFPAERFARCIAAPSRHFRQWLVDGLRAAMTDWQSHATPPDGMLLRRVFRDAVSRCLGWQLEDSIMGSAEMKARDEALADHADDILSTGRRLVADGIKLNANTKLVECSTADGRLLCLVRDGQVVRRRTIRA